MSRALLRSVVLLALLAVMPASAWAGSRDKLGTLLRDYGTISRELQEAQQTQAALLEQKATLDARGAELSRRQDTLNARPSTPNATVASPQRVSDGNQSRCADGKGAPPKGCDHAPRKLKKMGLEADAGVLLPETQQSELDLEFSRYDEAANDWNAREQQTIATLNRLYRSLNDWADRAERLITSAPFQAEVRAAHWQRYCPNRAMPSGVLSIDAVVGFADDYAGCLRHVAAHGD